MAVLGERSLLLLREMGIALQDPGPDLTVPGEPTFRVGEIGIGRADENILVALSPTEDDTSDPVAVSVSPERLGAMARRALEVVAAGRPSCEFCGNPKDPEGHTCPASNGDLRRR